MLFCCHIHAVKFVGSVESLSQQLSDLEASSADLSRNLQELQQEHSKVRTCVCVCLFVWAML